VTFVDHLKRKFFNNTLNTTITLIVILFLIKFVMVLGDWLLLSATFSGSGELCRQNGGFCYPFIKEKLRYILFGIYPKEYIWRPIVAVILMLGGLVRLFVFSKKNLSFFIKFIALQLIYLFLLKGGLVLEPVASQKWGGLALTLLLSSFGIGLSYPLGILLALGRRASSKIISFICTVYIELIRGVPLISVLFMSSVLFPLFLPESMNINKLLRAQLAIILFSAAYMAEVVRGGLASIDKGQYEAAESLNLNYFQTMFYIILPQALIRVIPPTVSTAIGIFKDTSLVLIISLFDLLTTAKTSVKDPNWLGFTTEAYVFVALIYFILCFSMSLYSKKLEKELVS
jgi:general L-amino acid transport system permease protein